MLIPAIAFGPSRESDIDDGLTLDFLGKISVLGPVMVSVEDLEQLSAEGADMVKTKELLKRVIDKTNSNSITPCYLEGLTVDQDTLATELLDAGLHGVFFQHATSKPQIQSQIQAQAQAQAQAQSSLPQSQEEIVKEKELKAKEEKELLKKVLSSFPRARVGLVIHLTEADAASPLNLLTAKVEKIVAENRTSAIHFYVKVDTNSQQVLDALVASAKRLVELSTSSQDNVHLYIGIPPAFYGSTKVAARISTTMSDNTIHAVLRPKVFSAPALPPVPVPEHAHAYGLDTLSAYISCIRSDRPDGLFTTVVCDEHGVSLGLVYSNDVSIRAAVHEKKGIYWSRSRGGLWRKGDSSGMHQELLSVSLDCDGDALRFTVIQHGTPPSFCHLMTRTCWGDVHGLQHLQSILQARLVSAPAGSYTHRLFTDETLLLKKLVEEAQELAEAKTHDEVAGEAADLMYFLMTRCVAAGVSLRDIEKKLDYRSLKVTRRPGNAKDWRSENAAKILAGQSVNAPVETPVEKESAPVETPAVAPAPAPLGIEPAHLAPIRGAGPLRSSQHGHDHDHSHGHAHDHDGGAHRPSQHGAEHGSSHDHSHGHGHNNDSHRSSQHGQGPPHGNPPHH